MTKRDAFIELVEELISHTDLDAFYGGEDYLPALEFFEEFKKQKQSFAKEITENGIKILQYMQNNYQKYNNVFKAKEIGEGLFVSSRSVSGSMKKLITDGFVNKIGTSPVVYEITEKGKNKDLNNI